MRKRLSIGITAGLIAVLGAAAIVLAAASPGTAQPQDDPARDDMQAMVQQCLAHMGQMDEMMEGMGEMMDGMDMGSMSMGGMGRGTPPGQQDPMGMIPRGMGSMMQGMMGDAPPMDGGGAAQVSR